MGVANDEENVVPARDLYAEGRYPKLTVGQAAIIQGFPEEWEFFGGKTARYRQVGNAFPPPVAEAVGRSIVEALGRTGPILPDPDVDDDVQAESLFPPEVIPEREFSPAFADNADDLQRTLSR
jgi:DNA (cytosine-5)-methyltransferase 1